MEILHFYHSKYSMVPTYLPHSLALPEEKLSTFALGDRAPPAGTETTQISSAVRNLLSPSAHFDPTLLHFRMDENKLYILKILFPLPTLVGFSYHVGLGGQDWKFCISTTANTAWYPPIYLTPLPYLRKSSVLLHWEIEHPPPERRQHR